jgi:uncharacterized membrane protein
MEIWFIWSIVATIFAGLHVFIQKIGSARDYNSNLLNTYGGFFSGCLGLVAAFFMGGYGSVSWAMFGFAAVAGATYLVGSNLRMDAMRHIDTTILLPLHKFISPLFVLFFGVVIFNEVLTTSEWWGIIMGVLVPLLLISRFESSRQNNLKLGLTLLLMSAAITAGNAAINKYGVSIFESVLLFAAFSHFGSTALGFITHKLRRKRSQQISHHHFDKRLLLLAGGLGVIQFTSFNAFLYAFATGGPLAVVYTIHSLYIVIPIVLAILFYKEHWNLRKAVAIAVSVAAIVLMG